MVLVKTSQNVTNTINHKKSGIQTYFAPAFLQDFKCKHLTNESSIRFLEFFDLLIKRLMTKDALTQ